MSKVKLKRSLRKYFTVKLELKSASTQKSAKFALDLFSTFTQKYHNCTPDKMISDTHDKEDAMDDLQAFVNWYAKQKTIQGERPNNRTVRIVFHIVRKFYFYMGIKIYKEDYVEEITLPTVEVKDKHGVKKDEIIKILSNVSFRKKCLYLAQISSGARIGELLQLRKKDLDLNTKRITVHIKPESTKKKKGRITFFSKEFDKLYRFKINQMKDDELLFTNNPKGSAAVNIEVQNMQYVTKKVGLEGITTHSFRAYFITKMMRHDRNLSFMLTGQDGYLMEYDRLDAEEKLEKYIEYEGDLLIFESNNDDISNLKDRINDLEEILSNQNTLTVDTNDNPNRIIDIVNKILAEKFAK